MRVVHEVPGLRNGQFGERVAVGGEWVPALFTDVHPVNVYKMRPRLLKRAAHLVLKTRCLVGLFRRCT